MDVEYRVVLAVLGGNAPERCTKVLAPYGKPSVTSGSATVIATAPVPVELENASAPK